MFLQDPSLPELSADYLFPLAEDCLVGTGSCRVAIDDSNEAGVPLFPGLNWADAGDLSFKDFAKAGLIDNPQFHQVNTFAVINAALDMVEEEMGHPIVWKNGGPLVVRPHAFEGMNAYYDPINPSLNFGYFTSPFRRAPVWTCLSHDVVTHELGHAVLDTFRPLYVYAPEIDTPALHESFADLMAMLSALRHADIVKHLYRETHGDMQHPSLLSRLAEEFGQGIAGAGTPYLRSALEGPSYEDAPKEAHARSTVWTAAMYRILERLVSYQKDRRGKMSFDEFCDALAHAAEWVKGMVIRALHYTPPNALTMPMLAQLICAADAQVFKEDSAFRNIAQEVFKEFGLWNDLLDLVPPDLEVCRVFASQTDAKPTTLLRLVAQNREALRIPAEAHRILYPHLVSTTRCVDNIGDGEVKPVTEHYLEYCYEMIEPIEDFSTGELVPFVVYGGGTLVMNEQWESVLLATYPEAQIPEPEDEGMAIQEGESPEQSWTRLRQRFEALHGDHIQRTVKARGTERSCSDRPVVPGCPFVVQKSGSGAYQLVHRRCNWHEHTKSLLSTRHGLIQR